MANKLVSKRAIADFVHKWEKITSNVERNAAELPPHIPQYAAPLVEVLKGLQEIEAAKQNRRALKQQEVKDSNELLRRGIEAAEKLQAVIIGHHGPKSELLVGYDIKPRRRRKRKKGQPEPNGTGSPPPEEKSAPQAGGPSKPAARVTKGKEEVPQAAEQPKPEDPAPAPQSNPAPQKS